VICKFAAVCTGTAESYKDMGLHQDLLSGYSLRPPVVGRNPRVYFFKTPTNVTASKGTQAVVTSSTTTKKTGQKRADPEEPTPQEKTHQDSQPRAKRAHHQQHTPPSRRGTTSTTAHQQLVSGTRFNQD